MTAHPVDVYVGKKLRLRRTIMGLSQEAVGTAIGVTFQQVQKYERGINRMGASRLYDFSRILGIPVSYFFEGFSNDNNYASAEHSSITIAAEGETEYSVQDAYTSKETADLLRSYYRIKDPHVRRRLQDLIKSMVEAEEKANLVS